MKTTNILIISLLAFLPALVSAQDFKFTPKSAAKVRVTTIAGDLMLESYAGKDIVVSGTKADHDDDDDNDTKGLQLVNGSGVQDNTGFGINITETDGTVVIRGLASNKNEDIKIMIPEKMNITVSSKGWVASGIKMTGFKSEVEVKSEYASVVLNNVTGPVVLNVTYGQVKAVFDKVNQEKPISLIATYNDLDVTLPADTKADLQLESDYGNVYTDFQIALEKTGGDDLEPVKTKDVKGKINSGGVKIHLESPYKNVYLRKKK